MKTSTLKSSTRLAYDKRKGLQEKADHVVDATTLARSLKAPFRDGHQKEISPMNPQSVETKGAFTPQTEAKLPSEEMKESFRLLRNEHFGDAFTTPPNDPPTRVGAIAVRGPGFSGLDDVSVCTYDNGVYEPDERTSSVTGTRSSGDTGALVADPVVEDDLEEQIREELEVEMRGEIATAEAVQGETKPSFWKRRSCIFACILSIVAVGAIVGALVGLQPGKDQSEPEDPNILRGLKAGDRWGDFAVLSRDGTTLAVGSDEASYAIVFRRNVIGKWEQLGQTLFGDGQFGRTLALNRNGSILAVGSWKNDDAGEDAGKAQVFWYNGTFWEEFRTFLGDAPRDHFGYFVEMSGTGRILTISAREADPDENRTDAGIVRTYKYSGSVEQRTGSWLKLGPDLQGEDAEEQFGKRLAMNEEGTRLAVSALFWNEKRGRIRTYDFSFDDETWIESTPQLEGPEENAWFGSALDMTPDGTKLVVGSDGKDANGEDSGWVAVYSLNNGTWEPYGDAFVGGEFDRLGIRGVPISDDGNCVAMGGSHYQNRTGIGYLYQWTGEKWAKAAQVVGDDFGDRFGGTTTLSGDCKWVAWGGSQQENVAGAGYVKVYEVQDLLDRQGNTSRTNV